MKVPVALLLLLLLLFLCISVNANLYLLLEEGQKARCFLEEVPKDTLVLGKYKSELHGAPGEVPGIKVIVYDPDGQVALQREMNPSGRFAFTSQIGGEYKMCFQPNSARWFSSKQKIRLFLDIQTGESAIDYEEVASQEHLSALEVSVRRLNDKIRDIRGEQNYQRNREIIFRDTSESTNGRVMWWSVIQTMILVGTGLWQITHLKNFFKTKKLV